MGITTKEIAKICGVSRTTVHRALNNTGRISEKTKQYILEMAEKNGYRPDLLATGLAKGKTYYIGVVVMDVNNRYFSQMLSALEVKAREQGYFINITLHQNNKEIEKEQLCKLADYHVDGIILSSVNKGEEYKKFIESLNIPVVTIDNKVAEGIPFVTVNGRAAIREAVKLVIQSGYEKIVFVCPPLADKQMENIYVHEERTAGFLEAVQQRDNLEYVVLGDWEYKEKAWKELEKEEKRTVFLCTGDMFALDLMRDLKKKGKYAGKDYGIMGYDNIDFLEYVSPRLTTIENHVERVATEALNLLLELMDKSENKKESLIKKERILETVTVEGETIRLSKE